MADDKKYPLWLHHPNEQPAIVSDDYQNGPPRLGYAAPAGQARMFPPVQVNSPDQETYYVSRGYEPGQSVKPPVAQLPQGFQYQEYPRIENGVLVSDPQIAPVDTQYPKWIDAPGGRVLVNTAAEEAALVPPAPPPEMTEAEREFLAALDEAQRMQDESPDDLFSMALSLGIKADRRWGERRLREAIAEIEQETAPR